MAALGTYTTTQAVRGCFGVDASDCQDAIMVDSKLDLELVVDLDAWLPAHAALYATGTAGGATAAQKAVSDRITLYAQWFCTHELANRPHLVPQIVTDGKAQLDRFKVDLELVAKLAAQKMAQYRAALDSLVNGITPVTSGLGSLIGIAVPDSDPVTEGLQ